MVKTFHRLLFSFVLSMSLLVPAMPVAEAWAATKTPVVSSRQKSKTAQTASTRKKASARRKKVNTAKSSAGRKKAAPAASLASLGPDDFRDLLSSRSAIVLDANTGETLYAHNPDNPAQPASTIKVLTGLISIQSLNDNDRVPVSGYAAEMPRSKVYLRQGRSYYADDLINAVLLASANDASVALAEKVAGSEHTFASLMTRKAEDMGAGSTMCRSASGLTRPDQYTTARDLATIFNGAMKDEEFSERIGLKTVKTRDGKILRTHNKAFWNVEGTVGGKTGYTQAARQTYVGKFRRGEDELIVALMGSETMWADVSRLVEYGFVQRKKAGDSRLTGNPGGNMNRLPVAGRIAADRQLAAVGLLALSRKASNL